MKSESVIAIVSGSILVLVAIAIWVASVLGKYPSPTPGSISFVFGLYFLWRGTK